MTKPRFAKIAISLPVETLAEIERLREERDQTRSAFILEAVEEVLRAERGRVDVERHIRGYEEFPETEEEWEWGQVGLEMLADDSRR